MNKLMGCPRRMGTSVKMVRVNCMMTDGNQTFSEHAVVYTEVELLCCTPESYLILSNKVTLIKKKSGNTCVYQKKIKELILCLKQKQKQTKAELRDKEKPSPENII